MMRDRNKWSHMPVYAHLQIICLTERSTTAEEWQRYGVNSNSLSEGTRFCRWRPNCEAQSRNNPQLCAMKIWSVKSNIVISFIHSVAKLAVRHHGTMTVMLKLGPTNSITVPPQRTSNWYTSTVSYTNWYNLLLKNLNIHITCKLL